MASEEKGKFLTVAEVAEIMRVSKMTVYRLVHSGELTGVHEAVDGHLGNTHDLRDFRDGKELALLFTCHNFL